MEIRELQRNDLSRKFLETLAALRDPELTEGEALDIFFGQAWHGNTVCFVAVENDEVVGTATIFIEQKYIHKGGKVGHIEDVAVRPDKQGKGIGQRLVEHLIAFARKENCYKVILDCKADLIPFYEILGFHESDRHMRLDL